jgi:hypothetical protein
MPYILDGIDWHWKAFVEGKVGEYLDLVKDVEDAVGDTVTAFSDRAAASMKTVGDTMLAAVAVIIASFIASAFKDPFNATLFRFGLRAYSLYVITFPGLLGLSASHYAMRSALHTFTSRIARFKETLHPDKIDAVVGTRVADAERGYYRWLAAVAIIYMVVAFAGWQASTRVPQVILNDPAATSPASAPPAPAASASTAPVTVTTSPALSSPAPPSPAPSN